MKTLELNQMEKISGETCGGTLAIGLTSVINIAAFSGPFGWGVALGLSIVAVGIAYGCGNATEF
jgi:hypothetical protein